MSGIGGSTGKRRAIDGSGTEIDVGYKHISLDLRQISPNEGSVKDRKGPKGMEMEAMDRDEEHPKEKPSANRQPTDTDHERRKLTEEELESIFEPRTIQDLTEASSSNEASSRGRRFRSFFENFRKK